MDLGSLNCKLKLCLDHLKLECTVCRLQNVALLFIWSYRNSFDSLRENPKPALIFTSALQTFRFMFQ